MTIPTTTFPAYDSGTPKGADIPADSQEEFINNFFTINQQMRVDHIPPGNIVKTVKSNGATSTLEVTNHYLKNGDNITLTNFKAINALGNLVSWSINGNSYDITLINDNHFSIPVDTTAQPTYLENSGSYLVNEPDFYGFHKKITFFSPTLPFTSAQISGNKTLLFTQKVTDAGFNSKTGSTTQVETEGFEDRISIALFFQNLNKVMRLTGNNYNEQFDSIDFPPPDGDDGVTVVKQFSIDTPFGIKINFGEALQVADAKEEEVIIPLKLPYTTAHLGTFATILNRKGVSSSARITIPSADLTSFTSRPHSTGNVAGVAFKFISLGI